MSTKGTTSAAPLPPEPALAALRKKADAARDFVHAGVDNSIPTYGSEATPGEGHKAEAALRAYLRVRAAGNWAAACAGLSAGTRKGFERLSRKGGGCAAVYRVFTAKIPVTVRATPLHGGLVSLRVQGPNGFALFYGPGRQQYVMPMRREGGVWKMTQISAIEYPPGEAVGRP